MLKIIYGFVETAETDNGVDKMIKECVDKISNHYTSIPDRKFSQ